MPCSAAHGAPAILLATPAPASWTWTTRSGAARHRVDPGLLARGKAQRMFGTWKRAPGRSPATDIFETASRRSSCHNTTPAYPGLTWDRPLAARALIGTHRLKAQCAKRLALIAGARNQGHASQSGTMALDGPDSGRYPPPATDNPAAPLPRSGPVDSRSTISPTGFFT